MLHIAAVEDDPACAGQLQEYVQRLAQENALALDFSLFASAEALLAQRPGLFDLILLDIELPGVNGMEAAARLRQADQDVVLLFVTNMAQYAVQGYAVQAFDFLVKPVAYDTFSFTMRRAIRQAEKRQHRLLVLRFGGDSYTVPTHDLHWLEVQGHSLICHTAQRTITVRGSLQAIESQLVGLPFSRCNNCYLVNLAQVSAVEGYLLTLQSGQQLQISRSRRTPFLRDYARYLGGLEGTRG